MGADLPDVAELRYGGTRNLWDRVGRIRLLRGCVETADPDVDLRHVEAGHRDLEVQIEF